MIGLFSPSVERALLTASSWLLIMWLMAALYLLLPPRILLFLMAGPYNLTGILVSFACCPGINYLIHSCHKLHRSIPRVIRSLVESFYVALAMVLRTLLSPSRIMTWATLGALAAAVASGYWSLVKYIATDPEGNSGDKQKRDGFFFLHTVLIGILSVVALTLLLVLLPKHTGIIFASLGSSTLLLCLLSAALVSTVFVSFAVKPQPASGTDAIAVAHSELYSVACSLAAVICLIVSDIYELV